MPADREAVRALVASAGLPLSGLEDQFPQAFVLARSGDRLVGCAALEVHGTAGLLRSLAVAEGERGCGLGATLVADRLRAAQDARLAFVYLLTTTAERYFGRFGFVVSPRAGAPAGIAQSPEFAHACPASATCLKLTVVQRL
jgi:N-acetylglutamate synthase-like GNAT family acetyltransferase